MPDVGGQQTTLESPDLERLRIELRLKEIELEKTKLDKSSFSYWTSPTTIAVITGVLGLFAAGLANYMQSRANVTLERQKFESAAFLKAIDTQDTDKAAKLIVFMVKAKLLSDPTGTLAALENHPEQTPLLPPSSHMAADESKLSKLQPNVADMARNLITKAKEKGVDVLLLTGYRSPAEQDELYAQGRTKPGHIVTNARAGQSTHNCGLAFDVAILDPSGSIDWQTSNPGWKTVISIAKGLGLDWGGDKAFPDLNHFEQPGANCNQSAGGSGPAK